jgi:hypothetical protein
MNLPPRSRASRLLAKLLLSEGLSLATAEQLEGRQLLDAVVNLAIPITPEITGRPTNPLHTVIIDFDDDGKDEIVVFGSNRITFLRYQNANSLVNDTARSRDYAYPGIAPVVFDANGDGKLDFMIGKWLALNDGNGAFPSPWTSVAPVRGTTYVTKVTPVELNGDNSADVAVTYNDGGLLLFTNDGAGNYTLAGTLNNDSNSGDVQTYAVRGFAGDANETLLVERTEAGERRLYRAELDGAGRVTQTRIAISSSAFAQASPQSVRYLDVDRDGVLDVIQSVGIDREFNYWDWKTGTLIHKGNRDGTFAEPRMLSRQQVIREVTDIDGNGSPDVLLERERWGISTGSGRVMKQSSHGLLMGEQSLDSMIPGNDLTLREEFDDGSRGTRTFATGKFFIANIDGDSDKDLLWVSNLGISFQGPFPQLSPGYTISWQRSLVRPLTVTDEVEPSSNLFAFEDWGVSFPAGWKVYFDTNDDGEVTTGDSESQYSLSYRNQNPPGFRREFWVSPERSQVRVFEYRTWGSVFMPEGWCNANNVNEYLPLVNPSGLPVDYRVVIRYASGERDQVFATGTLAPHSRGGVTLTERGRPSAIRPNEAYSIEVQSTDWIGATFVHYDNFGNPGRGQAAGESLRGDPQSDWRFGDLGGGDTNFLLFFAPTAADITVTLTSETGSGITQSVQLAAMRRGGLYLGAVPSFQSGLRYNARVHSSVPVFASLTTYAQDSASISWGETGPVVFGQPSSLKAVAVRSNLVSTLVLDNPQSFTERLDVEVKPDNAPAQVVSVAVLAGSRREIALSSFAVAGTTSLSVRVVSENGGITSFITLRERDSSRRDATSTTRDRTTSNYHLFAEGYLDPSDRSNRFEDTISFYNPSTDVASVTMRFFLPDGRIASASTTVGARTGKIVRMNDLQELISLPGLRWYGTEVSSSSPISATFTHWDRNQPGGISF